MSIKYLLCIQAMLLDAGRLIPRKPTSLKSGASGDAGATIRRVSRLSFSI